MVSTARAHAEGCLLSPATQHPTALPRTVRRGLSGKVGTGFPASPSGARTNVGQPDHQISGHQTTNRRPVDTSARYAALVADAAGRLTPDMTQIEADWTLIEAGFSPAEIEAVWDDVLRVMGREYF